jgi:hypothetical protein
LIWQLSHRACPQAKRLANRHYSRRIALDQLSEKDAKSREKIIEELDRRGYKVRGKTDDEITEIIKLPPPGNCEPEPPSAPAIPHSSPSSNRGRGHGTAATGSHEAADVWRRGIRERSFAAPARQKPWNR